MKNSGGDCSRRDTDHVFDLLFGYAEVVTPADGAPSSGRKHSHPADHAEIVDPDLLGQRRGLDGLQPELADHTHDLGRCLVRAQVPRQHTLLEAAQRPANRRAALDRQPFVGEVRARRERHRGVAQDIERPALLRADLLLRRPEVGALVVGLDDSQAPAGFETAPLRGGCGSSSGGAERIERDVWAAYVKPIEQRPQIRLALRIGHQVERAQLAALRHPLPREGGEPRLQIPGSQVLRYDDRADPRDAAGAGGPQRSVLCPLDLPPEAAVLGLEQFEQVGTCVAHGETG